MAQNYSFIPEMEAFLETIASNNWVLQDGSTVVWVSSDYPSYTLYANPTTTLAQLYLGSALQATFAVTNTDTATAITAFLTDTD